MSTSCWLAKKVSKNRYKAIYVHWDGYPKTMLDRLNRCYSTTEAVDEILALGNASYLEDRLYPLTGEHCFDHPEEGCSVFYTRDRKESGQEAFTAAWKDLLNADVDYVYIFKDEKWSVL